MRSATPNSNRHMRAIKKVLDQSRVSVSKINDNTVIKYESKSDHDEDLEQRDFKSVILNISPDDF